MALGGFAFGLGVFAAVLLAILTGVLWRLLARRTPRLAWVVVVVGALLVVGCFAPPTRTRDVQALQGTATGSAWLPVVAGSGGRVETTGGAASVERLANGTWLRLDCAAGCAFHGGTRGDDPGASVGVDPDRLPDASIQGAASVTSTLLTCVRLPFVVGLAFGGSDCVPCADVRYESDAQGRLTGAPGPSC